MGSHQKSADKRIQEIGKTFLSFFHLQPLRFYIQFFLLPYAAACIENLFCVVVVHKRAETE